MCAPHLSISDLKADGKDFEVVFVSSDRDDASFLEYYGEMPWLALPLRDRARAAALSDKFKVSGIPTLVRSRALLLRCCCRMNGLGWETGGVALCLFCFSGLHACLFERVPPSSSFRTHWCGCMWGTRCAVSTRRTRRWHVW